MSEPTNNNMNYQTATQPAAGTYYTQDAPAQYKTYQQQPAAYYQNYQVSQTNYISRAALVMAGVGAIVGGSAAAAKNIRKVKKQEIANMPAVIDTVKEATGAGIATGVATAVVGYTKPGSLLSVLGTVAVATGTKYVWDSLTTAAKKAEAAETAEK